jgi:alkylated DNA repair protein (DNA oxidative demethylase)
MTPAERTVVHHLSPADQAAWVEDVRRVCEASPLVRPQTPNGMPMRVKVTAAGRLGWMGGPQGYRYDPVDSRGKPWPEMPERWSALADLVAGPHPWDSAIVNWYDPDASLGWHVDRSEVDRSLPIVTVSLGDACSWAVKDDEGKASRVRLESGAVTLLAGPLRRAEHTVERIIPAPMFSPLRKPGRISVTLRVAGDLREEQAR